MTAKTLKLAEAEAVKSGQSIVLSMDWAKVRHSFGLCGSIYALRPLMIQAQMNQWIEALLLVLGLAI